MNPDLPSLDRQRTRFSLETIHQCSPESSLGVSALLLPTTFPISVLEMTSSHSLHILNVSKHFSLITRELSDPNGSLLGKFRPAAIPSDFTTSTILCAAFWTSPDCFPFLDSMAFCTTSKNSLYSSWAVASLCNLDDDSSLVRKPPGSKIIDSIPEEHSSFWRQST
jgi:hypothetical protein